jgi:hypothetical protein
MPDSAAASASVLTDFAYRVATRDDPPGRPASYFGPEAVEQRLGAGLAARFGARDVRRVRTLGRMAYALMQSEWQPNAALAAATGHTTQAAQRVADGLVRLGLLEVRYVKNTRQQRLSRAGEDLLLALANGTPLPEAGI